MKILIISEYIAPLQAIASVRWTKIVKYIKQKHPDVEITVLTNKKNYASRGVAAQYSQKDELLEKELQYFDEYLEISPDFCLKTYNFLKNIKNKIKAFHYAHRKTAPALPSTEGMRVTYIDALHDIKSELWRRQACKSLSDSILNTDIIISTYGPFWTHMVANYIKDKNPNAIWLADFRDFYADESNSPSAYKRHIKYTMNYCASADVVMRVLDELKTFTPSHIPVYTIPNGFDPEEQLNPFPPTQFSIVFTGVMFGQMRDIGIACKAVKELCAENLMERKDVEIAYAGPHGAIAKGLAAKYDAGEYIYDYGTVPRIQALKMQQYAAILLQLNWNTQREKCGWSGKMYEYMMAQKPILYIVTGNMPYSMPSREIYRLGGYCYEKCRHEETYQGLKNFILEKYQEWKITGDVSVQQDKKYIEQYSYPHIAEQVWELIQNQMERKKTSESTTA